MIMGRDANFSDGVTEVRRSVRAEEERIERCGWIVNYWRRQDGWDDSSVLYVSDRALYNFHLVYNYNNIAK